MRSPPRAPPAANSTPASCASGRPWIWQTAQHALGPDGTTHPLLRPLGADLTGLPPLLVQCATADRARAEAEELAHRAETHGVDVELDLHRADTHVFQVYWPFLPEAADALERAGAFVRRVRDLDALPDPGGTAARDAGVDR